MCLCDHENLRADEEVQDAIPARLHLCADVLKM